MGKEIPSIGLNAVVGRPPEEYGMEPTSLHQLRTGCYDADERIKDINVNGIAASMNFASFPGLDGGPFDMAQKEHGLQHIQARNDWHIDQAPHAPESPIEAWIATMPMSISIAASDWLNLAALHKYPDMRIALSEGSIGRVPYFMERADFAHKQHHAWTKAIGRAETTKDVFMMLGRAFLPSRPFNGRRAREEK